jgi:hypothetical protein
MIAEVIASQDKSHFEFAWMFIHKLLSDTSFHIDNGSGSATVI